MTRKIGRAKRTEISPLPAARYPRARDSPLLFSFVADNSRATRSSTVREKFAWEKYFAPRVARKRV